MARRAVAEVNLAAIERNASRLRRRLTPHTELCGVVKADGYGHGAGAAARAALAGGVTRLAVATAQEAIELRDAAIGGARILILGAISSAELPLALAADAEVVAWDLSFVEHLRRCARGAGRRCGVHVKLDTGLGRLGTRSPKTALEVAAAVRAAGPSLSLCGVMTHLATADEEDHAFTAHQLGQFAPLVRELRALHGGPGDQRRFTAHAANSAATLRYPQAHHDMVRAGIALYGADPMNADPGAWGLEPALALRSYVAAVKTVAPGESAGYGRHFVAERATTMATLPIGYGDGVPRRSADHLDVLIGGRRHPLRGMVSMDNVTVEVGPGTTVEVGQLATIIGVDGGSRLTSEDIARRLGTINYEVLCGISARVPRVYHHDGTRM